MDEDLRKRLTNISFLNFGVFSIGQQNAVLAKTIKIIEILIGQNSKLQMWT